VTAAQVRRIPRLLDWDAADLRRRVNRVARTNYRPNHVAKWLGGARWVRLAVVVFLRMELQNSVGTRRILRVLWDREAGC
jgi:hypothetical protein